MNKCRFCGRFIKDVCPRCKPLEENEIAIKNMRFSTKDTWIVMSIAVESYLQSILDKMFNVEKRGQRELRNEYIKMLDNVSRLNGIALEVIHKLYGLSCVNEVVENTEKILNEVSKQAIKLERK